MKSVSLARSHSLPSAHAWTKSAGDLAIEVTEPLLSAAPIDALFVSSPASMAVDGQALGAAIVADRIGLAGVPSYLLEAGDASGAAALHAAYAQVAAGLSRCALVVGIAKVSDKAERARGALMDALIDREAEESLGLTYQALCGLLADLYLQRHGLKPGALAHVCAKNAANAVAGGESFLPYAPSAMELRKDIPVAPPLVRSDFAPLLDGASAVLVAETGLARELCKTPIDIIAVAAAGDIASVAERKDPLAMSAVAGAVEGALGRAGIGREDVGFWEVSANATILEVLSVEAAELAPAGCAPSAYKEGLGGLSHERVINPSGGAQGRGLALGNGGIEQAREALLQLSGQAGGRQVGRADPAAGESATAVAVCTGGIGTSAYATVFRRSR